MIPNSRDPLVYHRHCFKSPLTQPSTSNTQTNYIPSSNEDQPSQDNHQ